MTINMVVRVLEKRRRRLERLKMLGAILVSAIAFDGILALWLLEVI